MVHIGEARFYDEVHADALDHDIVLFEGVRSPVGRNFTRSYRWLRPERLGLVVQSKLTPAIATGVRLVHADLDTEEFHREWRKVAWYWRGLAWIAAPIYGVHQRLFATRASIAKRMNLEDLRSADEVLRWTPDLDAFERSIGEARDERLLKCLEAELGAAEGSTRIAVVYGARHIRSVIRELTKLGFRCSEARWLTIFKT
jgi:hypothetical protein